MSQAGDEAELRRLAEQRVDARRGFYAHATVFIIVNSGLAAMNLLTSPHYLWFLWPLFGWGIGLAAHGWRVFEAHTGDRERAIQAEMDRLRASRR